MMKRSLALIISIWVVFGCDVKWSGPEPEIISVERVVEDASGVEQLVLPLICTAQFDNELRITGTGFSPAVVDVLTSGPTVLLPEVLLIGPDGSEVLLGPAEAASGGEEPEVQLIDGNPDEIHLQVAQGALLPDTAVSLDERQEYAVQVVNPDGSSALWQGQSEENGLTWAGVLVVPPPLLTDVQPNSAHWGTTTAVTLTGTGFRAGMTVTLDTAPAIPGTNVTVESETTATAEFNLANADEGTYSITVQNTAGCSDTLVDAFTVTSPPMFELLGIDPPFGWHEAPTNVTIFSDGNFVSTPSVKMYPSWDASLDPVVFERVAFIDGATITAVVPAGALVGTYDVVVTNPPYDGRIGRLENGFRVVDEPIPLIITVSPSRGTTEADTPVSIIGENFRDPVRVELLDLNEDVATTIEPVTPVSATQIDVTLPTQSESGDLPVGVYLVRVTNLDEETYYTWSSFVVTSQAGNLNPYTSDEPLATGRRLLTGVFANDDLGNRYIYAIGGDTGQGGEVLDSVELSQLSRFGQLAQWHEQRNEMISTRVGASAVAVPVFTISPYLPVKTYIYVTGGRDATDVILDTVERAVVLSGIDVPRVTGMETSTESGTLEPGTWYYKVSAVLSAADPDNPSGETLPSDEAIVTLAEIGSITLTWDALTVNGLAASLYRIYRTDQVNGVSQEEHLIAEVGETTYTDDSAAAGTESPLQAGDTGVFVQVGTMTTPRWGHQAVLLHDATGARYIYALGGKDAVSGGVLGSVEMTPVDADGQIGAFDASGTSPLITPRAFFSAIVEDSSNVSTFTQDDSRIIAITGVGTDGSEFQEIEYCLVTTAAGNEPFIEKDQPIPASAGRMSVITNDKLFMLGGALSANDTTFGSITSEGRDIEFDATGGLEVASNNTEVNLLAPRALGVGLQGAGFIYLVGGTSNGTNALDNTERTF